MNSSMKIETGKCGGAVCGGGGTICICVFTEMVNKLGADRENTHSTVSEATQRSGRIKRRGKLLNMSAERERACFISVS